MRTRVLIIDALRGFALAGVGLVHMREQYIASMAPVNLMEVTNTLFDSILDGVISFFIIGKFFALFSLLFGLSFFIQMNSAAQRNQKFELRFLWRAILLFGIGFIHQLFYKGDILTIYALLVPFLIPFYRVSSKWILFTAGIFLISVPRFLVFLIHGNESFFGLPPMMGIENQVNMDYITLLKTGSLTEIFRNNGTLGFLQKMDFQLGIFARFYLTFGYFLIGLWLGKIGLFTDLAKQVKQIKKTLWKAVIGLVIAFGFTALFFSQAPQPVDFKHWLHILGINAYTWSNIALTALILCGFLLIFRNRQKGPFFNLLVPYGRMALTNYVLQSIIATGLLFGWGVGLLGQLQMRYLVIIAILLILLQMIASKIWLRHFRYGPLEWLWRSGTYLQWQQFRK